MRKYVFAASIALLAATATVASASSRSRDRDRDRDRHHHHEGEHGRGGDRVRSLGPIDPTYAKECGACHVAYPPGLLPATAWRSIMSGLDRHFGQNAELDADVSARLERWLAERAAPEQRSGSGSSLRITDQPWFVDEHDDLPRGAVARPEVATMANCSACHPGAESWDFDDDRVKIPRG